MDFNKSLELVFKNEGGYSDYPLDKGGKTKYGITEAVARSYDYTGDMKDLSLGFAKEVYYKSYWTPIKAEQLPESLRFHVFDCAVNSGVSRAIKLLQKCANVKEDGVIGKITLTACKEVTPKQYSNARLAFLKGLDTWGVFGKGWENRINNNLEATGES